MIQEEIWHGAQVGTLIGIFPKIELTFRGLNREEINRLAVIFDKPQQTVQYFDANKNQMISMKTYTGDWKYNQKKLSYMDGVTCSFISVKRRA